MNINDPDTAFYITCVAMMVVGLVLLGVAVLLGKSWRLEKVADGLALLALAIFLMGPFMALIGPRS